VQLADALTLARGLASLPAAALILTRRDETASILVALAGFSDLLDGWLARRNGQTSLGAQLDPLADKLLADSALFALATRGRAPWLLVAPLLARDALVTVVRLAGAEALPPSTVARLKTGLLYASVTWLLRARAGSLVGRLSLAGLAGAVALAALSAWSYLRDR
jgi:cardiolipin synthase